MYVLVYSIWSIMSHLPPFVTSLPACQLIATLCNMAGNGSREARPGSGLCHLGCRDFNNSLDFILNFQNKMLRHVCRNYYSLCWYMASKFGTKVSKKSQMDSQKCSEKFKRRVKKAECRDHVLSNFLKKHSVKRKQNKCFFRFYKRLGCLICNFC